MKRTKLDTNNKKANQHPIILTNYKQIIFVNQVAKNVKSVSLLNKDLDLP